jgi:hypothetical protein
MYGGHFRYKKIIPQQVKGKKKWLKSITCWGFSDEHSQLRTEG